VSYYSLCNVCIYLTQNLCFIPEISLCVDLHYENLLLDPGRGDPEGLTLQSLNSVHESRKSRTKDIIYDDLVKAMAVVI